MLQSGASDCNSGNKLDSYIISIKNYIMRSEVKPTELTTLIMTPVF